MTPPREAEVLPVVQARTLIALTIASRALEFADPTSPVANDPHAWAKIGGELKYLELEVLHTAVMQMSGVSWETLASMQEVSKQSLHRRLAKKVRKHINQAQQDAGQLEDCIKQSIDEIVARLLELKKDVGDGFTVAAADVAARASSHRRWDSSGHA
jgi:hypothetical protein